MFKKAWIALNAASTNVVTISGVVRSLGLALAAVLTVPASVWGQVNFEWIGPPTNGFFTNPVNWSPNAIPGPLDDIVLNQLNAQVNFTTSPVVADLVANTGSVTSLRSTGGFGNLSLLVNSAELSGSVHLVAQGGSSFTLHNLGRTAIGGFGISPATLRVNGGTSFVHVSESSSFVVGSAGQASLEVLGGGQVNTTAAPNSLIAQISGTQGSVVVDGVGSRWTSGFMWIGQNGAATLDVTNGGRVEATTTRIAGSVASSGVVTLAGADATLSIGAGMGDLVVGGTAGFDGTAIVNIEPGGVLTAGDMVLLETGSINLHGGTLDIAEFVLSAEGQFDFQAGTLNVREDFSVAHPALGGTLALTPGKNLNVAGQLAVPQGAYIGLSGGNLGFGTLNLTGGSIAGSVFDLGTDRDLSGRGSVLARVVGGSGSSITATGTLLVGNLTVVDGFVFDGALDVGGHQVLLLSADTATLGATTTLGAGARLNAPNGAYLSAGRVLSASSDGLVDGDFTNDGQVNGPAGAGDFLTFNDNVDGAGNYSGNIEFLQGFSPGNSSAAVQFAGSVEFGSANDLEIEIGGTALGEQFDRLSVANNAQLAGTLQISIIDGFLPMAGQSFDILDWGSISGTFDAINLPVLDNGLGWNTSQLYTTGILSVTVAGDFDQDGDVDGRDFLIWQQGGSPSPLGGDDLADWQANYGTGSLAATSTAVPEPTSIELLLALVFTGFRAKR